MGIENLDWYSRLQKNFRLHNSSKGTTEKVNDLIQKKQSEIQSLVAAGARNEIISKAQEDLDRLVLLGRNRTKLLGQAAALAGEGEEKRKKPLPTLRQMVLGRVKF